MWAFAVYFLCECLINRNGEYEFVVVLASFDLFGEPLFVFHFRLFESFGCDVVESESKFLILIVLIEVSVVEVGLFFCCDNLFHEFYGRIVFSAVA